jgi:hypothetical protein
MKKLLAIVLLGLLWCNTSFAGREEALDSLKRKLIHGGEAFILAGVFAVIAILLAKIFKALFKINIESKYYYIIFIAVGVVLTRFFFNN